jgi:Zn-dependent peptidase ImmA (M78 family)
MAPRQLAHIKPELLVWARKQSSLSVPQAAKKIGVKPEKLEAWERGDEEPSVPQLRKAAKAYHFVLAVFFLPTPPQGFTPIKDFRRLPGTDTPELSPELTLELRNAITRREIALELFAEIAAEPPSLDVRARLDEAPEAVADRIREILDVTPEMQRAWGSPTTAFRGWRSLLEDAGVLAFQAVRVGVDEMRGFSLGDQPLPVVVVNRKDSSSGRCFSLMHEFAHILLRTPGLCDLHEDALPPDVRRVEVFCNHVAGATLIPEALLRAETVVRSHRGTTWTTEELAALTRPFGTSREVVLRRLLTLGLTTKQFYEAKAAELQRAFDALPKAKGGPMTPDVNAVSKAGERFIRLALDAFHQHKITSSTLLDYLGVKARYVDALEQRLTG